MSLWPTFLVQPVHLVLLLGLNIMQNVFLVLYSTSGSPALGPGFVCVDMSDVDTTLMLFAAATVCSRTESWQ